MCDRDRLDPDTMKVAMSELPTGPATGIHERPSEIEDAVMLAPTVDAARAIIAKLDERPNIA